VGWWRHILSLNRSKQAASQIPRSAQPLQSGQRVTEQINPMYFVLSPTREDWHCIYLLARDVLLYKIMDSKREGLIYTKILSCAIMGGQIKSVLPSRCRIDATNITAKKHPRADDRYRRSIVMDTLNPRDQNSNLPKPCNTCHQWKPATNEFFCIARRNKGGLCHTCKQCLRKPRDVESGYRRCSECKEVFPETPEYFHRNKKSKNGLLSVCKVCNNAKRKQYRKDNKEKVAESQKKYFQSHKEEYYAYRKQYNEANKEKLIEYRRQYYAEHREHDKQWRKDNSGRIAKRRKQYLEESKEYEVKRNKQWREVNRERLNESSQRWNENNKERVSELRKLYRQTERGIIAKRTHAHNRRALKRNAEGKHTSAQLRELYQQQEGKCFYCKKALGHSRNSWHGDHIVPLSKGGSNDINNIVIACPKCNLTKSNKLPHEWTEGEKLI